MNNSTLSLQELQAISSQIRRDILRMVHQVQSGHPGGSLGCADLFTALYFKVMNHQEEVAATMRDHFFLSNGHISPVYYSALARSGYFPIAELATFRKLNSRLQGHPTTHEGLPGVHIASGSLGQGLSVAVGTALSKQLSKHSGLVYCLMGDGELQEGQVWEAAMYAGGNKLRNLIAFVDLNGQQIDGPTQEVLPLLNVQDKFEAFGWQVLTVENGNSISHILSAIQEAQELVSANGPVMILLRTQMGKGVDFMEDDHQWHGVAPSDAQLEAALAQLPETLGDYPL